jgi:cell division protein FtsL
MLTILSTLFSSARTYIEIAVVVALVGVLGFYKLEDSRLTTELTAANQTIGTLNSKLAEQNTAIDDLKKAQIAAQAASDKALQTARQLAQTEYDKAKRIAATVGTTCDDAYNLFLQSVQP